MEEIEMVKQLGAVLDGADDHADDARLRVRGVIEREIDRMGGNPARQSRHRSRRTTLLIVAATLAVASLGGIAAAGGFSDGLGVDDPPGPKIPYVQAHIDELERELAGLDTSTEEGKARADFLNNQLTALREVKAQLCADAGEPEGC